MRQRQALSVMMSGENVFLTGPPGAGKTYVLKKFINLAKKSGKRVAVTASTGIAATHIGGTTIHSWAGMGILDSLNTRDKNRLAGSSKLIKRYNGTDILVIDEISMLHGARLDMINKLAKLLRQSNEPFGGLQVILVGDLFQLPPVSRGSDLMDFAHTSEAWAELDPSICYLSEQHRQTVDDGLLNLLEAMRSGDLEEYYQTLLTNRLEVRPPDATPITRLYAHNIDVDAINQRHLAVLAGDVKTYKAETGGRSAKLEQLQKGILAPEVLELKVGAEVMFVANNFGQGYSNGSRGQVVEFKDGWPMVKLVNQDRIIKVEPHGWTLEEDGRQLAQVSQLPLRLAWAITIHKSQGMSLDAAEIDLSKTFTPSMGYVALSRVRSLDGIYLRGINNMAMSMHPDIYEFDVQLRKNSAILAGRTADLPKEAKVGTATKVAQKSLDQDLLANLKKWRLQRARQDGVSAFIIAHNSLLEAIAQHSPTSRQQLLGLPGFGAHKLDKYGDEILRLVTSKK